MFDIEEIKTERYFLKTNSKNEEGLQDLDFPSDLNSSLKPKEIKPL